MDMPRLLTTKQLSEYMQIPVRTIEGWRLAGLGPPYARMGKHVRYSVPDVLDWLGQGGEAGRGRARDNPSEGGERP